ncbi:MAG: aminopeptidase P family protein [Lentisphaeria bacterium]|nr:aminopeptidase P family protein [Lentisphaerota bacterium]MBR2626387.1 aminopeptidase P family protein [Lentisphaeria bacterium]
MADTILTQAEFDSRVQRAQAVLAKTDLDAFLVFSTESEPAGVRYFSDYWPSFETAGVLIPRSGEAALIIGPESLTYASSRSKLATVIQTMDFRESSQPDYPGSAHPDWQAIMKRFSVKKLGITGFHMFPYTIMVNIAEALGGIQNIVNADAILRPVFMKKSALELDCLRKSAKISELGFKAVLENIKPGMTEAELCGIATAAMLANGAEATGYPVWCCSGPNSDQAISRPSLRKVGTGEIIHFSVGAKVEGYSSSIGRPIVLGKCPDEIRKFMQVGLDALNMTFDSMRAGVRAADVAKKVHGYIIDKGYGDAILYGPAHGCGQMECEYPFLETSSDYVLEENMTFMGDVFLHRNNMGFRWEDGLIVKAEGPAEELSSFARQINILEV